MTVKKDLKRRVRDRQRESGERYTAALEHLKQLRRVRKGPEIVDLPDLSALAVAAGLRCRAYCTLSLWEVEASEESRQELLRTALVRLAGILQGMKSDPRTELLRSALLEGKPQRHQTFTGVMSGSFLAALRFGVRGTSEDQRSIGFEVPRPRGGAPLALVGILWPSRAKEPILHLALASDWVDARGFFAGLVQRGGLR